MPGRTLITILGSTNDLWSRCTYHRLDLGAYMTSLLLAAWLPHCPRNRSHTLTTIKKGNRTIPMNIKTEAARAYEKALLKDLKKFEKEALEFKLSFDRKKHKLEAVWVFYTQDLMTADNAISLNSNDLDCHKVLQDVVMGFVGLNDAIICRDVREKVHMDKDGFKLYLSIVPIRAMSNDGDLLQ